ncbi:MAG: NHLP bacteriocin export ABC transporter permease/ATPase subunit [Elainellaceae cyanobacterium]
MNLALLCRQPGREIQANTPLTLTDPAIAWLVQSGSLAIFAVPTRDGVAEGERQFLFHAAAGDALFGHRPRPGESNLSLMAVPLEPSTIVPLRVEADADLEGSGAAPAHDLASLDLIDLDTLKTLSQGWIQKFPQTEGFPTLSAAGLVPEYHYLSLTPGQVLQPPPDQVLWVKVQQGRLHWLGQSAFPVESETGCYPIGAGTWLEAVGEVELFARATAQVKRHIILTKGLAQFHTYFFRCLEMTLAQAIAAEQERFQSRQQLNRQVTQSAIQTLASVLKTDDDAYLKANDPLLIAAGAVGKAMGVRIEPPSGSEDQQRVKEPLEAIARASQLRLRRILLRGDWWRQDGGPILGYTCDDHHPVALLPVNGDRYELFDPIAAGLVGDESGAASPNGAERSAQRVQVDEAIAATVEPVAYVFYRPLPAGSLNVLGLLKFALQGRQQDAIAVIGMGIVATLLGMLVPQATAVLVDQAIPLGQGGFVVQLGIGLLAVTLGVTAFKLAQAIALMRVETVSDATLQAAVWDRLLRLQTSFFRQYSIGDLNSRVSGITAIRRRLSGTVLDSIFSGAFALLNLGLLFYYSSQLALLALAVALLVIAFTTGIGVVLIRKTRPLLELEGSLYGMVVQLISGVPKLRVSGAEGRAFAHWGEKYAQQLRLELSTQQLEDALDVFNTVMPTITATALFWLASTLIDPVDGLSTGTFLAFSVAYGIFISGAASLSNSLIDVLDIVPLWQRSRPILNAQPEVNLDRADPGRLSGSIHIDHVTFRYREDGPLILDDVCMDINPGEFVAFVGPSGSGKSTILRLLLGFETPQSGTIYYDGQDLAGLDVSAVRRQLGVVLQNGRISAGTIFENIASGALVSMDDVWSAAEMSGLADDLRQMPMQLHTVVSEGGGNLSGGQRQRLMIARALVLQPRILLLDEATSALDNRTQTIVTQSMDQLNATRIVIAHRLSTIRHADRIYVLKAGRLVQQGSFEELASQPGLFAQLIQRQLA